MIVRHGRGLPVHPAGKVVAPPARPTGTGVGVLVTGWVSAFSLDMGLPYQIWMVVGHLRGVLTVPPSYKA